MLAGIQVSLWLLYIGLRAGRETVYRGKANTSTCHQNSPICRIFSALLQVLPYLVEIG